MAAFECMRLYKSIGIVEDCALAYPVWKELIGGVDNRDKEAKSRRANRSSTLSVGRSNARIAGSVLFGRVEGVREGRTRAAWQFPCHVSPTLGPAYDSDFPTVGSLPDPIGGPLLLVIRRVSLVRVTRHLLSVDRRESDRLSFRGLSLAANFRRERTKKRRVTTV